MNERIKNHVNDLFSAAPKSRRALELCDEMTANLTERYNDLIQQGKDEETAYHITIAGIGDMDDLIRSLREQDILDPVQMQMQRQKSALLISLAVAMYIVSFIFPILFGAMGRASEAGMITGVVLMFICWAVATMLLVYNALSKPKYLKADDTLVEEFKEWKVTKEKKSAMLKSIDSLVWLIATLLFFAAGFLFHAWGTAWLFFLLAPVVNHIVRLVFAYKGDRE